MEKIKLNLQKVKQNAVQYNTTLYILLLATCSTIPNKSTPGVQTSAKESEPDLESR